MTEADIDGALSFWSSFDGVKLNEGDDAAGLAQFLKRNPGLSFVAWEGERMVGAMLAGHDGRRGFLYHLAVAASRRGKGTGTALVEASLAALRQAGIVKSHVIVYRDNDGATAFWSRLKWRRRSDIDLHTFLAEA